MVLWTSQCEGNNVWLGGVACMVWYGVARLNQRIFKVLQSFIFAHSSISTAIQRSNNEDIKQQRGKRIRRFKESVHEYFPKIVPKFLDRETFRSRTSFIINWFSFSYNLWFEEVDRCKDADCCSLFDRKSLSLSENNQKHNFHFLNTTKTHSDWRLSW